MRTVRSWQTIQSALQCESAADRRRLILFRYESVPVLLALIPLTAISTARVVPVALAGRRCINPGPPCRGIAAPLRPFPNPIEISNDSDRSKM